MADLRDEEVWVLIQLLQSQENLYNFSLKTYYDREKTKESFLHIAREMGKNWTVDVTKAKVKWLRDGYTKSCRLIQAATKSGATADDVRVRWKWFKALDFLGPYCKSKSVGKSNLTLDSRAPQLDSQIGDSQIGDSLIGDSHTDNDLKPPLTLSQTTDLAPIFCVTVDIDEDESAQGNQHTRANSGSNISNSCNETSRSSSTDTRPVPHFAKQERKRRGSGLPASSQSTVILQEMLEQFKRRRVERRQDTENETFGKFVVAHLDKLKYVNQLKIKRSIIDILMDACIQEAEKSNTVDKI